MDADIMHVEQKEQVFNFPEITAPDNTKGNFENSAKAFTGHWTRLSLCCRERTPVEVSLKWLEGK